MTKKVREMKRANLIRMNELALLSYYLDIQDTKLRYELGEFTKKEALARVHAANEATANTVTKSCSVLDTL